MVLPYAWLLLAEAEVVVVGTGGAVANDGSAAAFTGGGDDINISFD